MKSKRLLLTLLMALLVPWAAMAQETLTVYENETGKNRNTPIFNYYFDDYTRAQTVFPAADLADMEGGTISAIKFYTTYTDDYETDVNVDVYLKEVESSTISSFVALSNATVVYTGKLTYVPNPDNNNEAEVTITFTTPFDYNGGNLLFGCDNKAKGDWEEIYYYGKTVSGASIYGNSSYSTPTSSSSSNFLPKTTFTYEAASTGGCEKPATVTASQIQPNSAMLNWEGGSDPGHGYNVEIKGGQYADWTRIYSNVSQGCLLNHLIENTAYQARVQVVCSANGEPEVASNWTSTSFSTPAYFSNFAVAIVPGEGNKAIFSWTENGFTPTEWQLCINGDEENLISMTSNPFTYDGLTPDVSTTAKMRAFVGDATGAWSNTVTFTPTDAYKITLNEGTSLNSYIPVNGNYNDYGNRSQFIIPASDLTNLQWASLNKLTFYPNAETYNLGTAEYTIYMKEVEYSTFASASFEDWSGMNTVYSGTLTISNNKMVIILNTPYTYLGGNLMIGFHETVFPSQCPSTSWKGVNQTSGSYTAAYDYANQSHTWYNTINRQTFLPQVTIDYTPGEEPSCLPPTLTLDDSSVTAHEASISWTGPDNATGWQICVNNDESNLITISENSTTSHNFTNLTGETTYSVKVRSNCGGGDSNWSNTVSFTTLVACPKPTVLKLEEITTTTAKLSWTEIGEATEWQICLNGDEEHLIAVTTNPYTLPNLTDGTTYTAKVRANCGGEDGVSAWSNQISFTTPCEARTIDGDNSYSISLKANTIADCWSQTTGNYQWSFDTYNGATFNATSSYTQTSTKLLSPLFTLGEGDYWLSFKGKLYGGYEEDYSGWGDDTEYTTTLQVYYRTSSTGEWMPLGDQPYSATGYSANNLNESEIVLPAGTCQLAFEATTEYSDYYGYDKAYAYLYEMAIVKAPSCLKPTSFDYSELTSRGAKFSWTSSASSWELCFSDGVNPDIIISTDENPFTINDTDETHLLPKTAYTAKVRANCGTDGYSEWSNTKSFTTLEDCIDMKVTSVTFTDVTFNSATINWTPVGNATQWRVEYSTSSDFSDPAGYYETDANSWALEGTLEPEGTYYVRVAPYCALAGAFTPWSNTFNFNTPEACPAPVLANPTEITSHGATFSWTGSYESYDVMSRIPAHTLGFSEQFKTTSLPTGWTRYSTLLTEDVLNGTTTLTTYSGGWSNTSYGLGEYNWKMNLYKSSSNAQYWMVTPSVDVETGFSLNFDAALTAYNSNSAPANDNKPDENSRFVVLITDDNMASWTVLQEWNAEGLNAISNSGTPFSFELANYVGKSVKVAFYGEQTASGPDCDLHIDNVAIGIAVPATTWEDAATNVEGNTVTVDDPTIFASSTPYEVKVVATCNNVNPAVEVESNVKTFTTDIACPAPTTLTVSNVKSTSAKLSWDNDASAWQICVNDDMDNLINVTENPYTLQGLTPEIEYTVKVRANCEVAITGDGFSEWTDAEVFTTISACTAPYQLAATNLTSSTADLSWDGEQEQYNVRYCKVTAGEAITTIEDFSNYTADNYDITTGGDRPSDWAYSTGNTSYVSPHVTNSEVLSSSWAISGMSSQGNFLYMLGSSNYAVMPRIENLTSFSFKYAFESSSNGTFKVGYVTDASNISSSFTQFENVSTPGSTSLKTVTLTSTEINTLNSTTGARLAFYFNYSGNYGFGIDDITYTAQSLTPGEWVNKSNVTSPLTIDNLEVYTMYEWQVQGINTNCEGGLTDWSDAKSFRTPYSLDIEGYTTSKDGYYLIASPIATSITPSEENGFLANNYDLYAFDESMEDEEWRNYEATTFDIVSGKGYLYANSEDVTLLFAGEPYSGEGVISLDYTEGKTFAGWNLVGNPFATAAIVDMDFYRMNSERNDLVAGDNNTVEAMEGIFVKATEEGQSVTFTATSNGARNASNDNALVVMNLTQSRGLIDRAIVRFNGGSQLPKFMLDETNTKLYIPQDGKNFAIVNAEDAGEMPVNFKANKNGEYTLAVNTENVDMSYLHLIDNMTGNDVNLLQTPSYTFNATTSDYESRFRLVFATGSSIDGDSFAFMNTSGNLTIFGIEGTATLQVVDVLGHVISSEQFSGSYEKHLEAAPGVYMLRLINGDNVMVQKIVVR